MTVTRGVAVGDRRGGLGVGCGVAAAKPPSTTTAPAAATILFIVCPFLGVYAQTPEISVLERSRAAGTDAQSLWSQASQHQHVSGTLSRLIASCGPTMRGAMASALLPTDTFRFLIGGTRASVGLLSGYLLREIPRTFRLLVLFRKVHAPGRLDGNFWVLGVHPRAGQQQRPDHDDHESRVGEPGDAHTRSLLRRRLPARHMVSPGALLPVARPHCAGTGHRPRRVAPLQRPAAQSGPRRTLRQGERVAATPSRRPTPRLHEEWREKSHFRCAKEVYCVRP